VSTATLSRRWPVSVHSGPALSVRLLGAFRVTLDGRPVDTESSRRTRNVMAYLFSHRRVPVSRDVLMEVFWPDAGPDAARNCLHVALTGVRRELRRASTAPVLQRAHDTYRLADTIAVWVDVEDFERRCAEGRRAEQDGDLDAAVRAYEAAAQLYGGDFFADDPYAEWAQPARDALRLLAVDAQTRLVGLYVHRGEYGPAVHVARWILANDPCNEVAHRQLMSCYAATGHQHLALGQYRQCADVLWSTFRVGPARETRRLYERLLAGASAAV
jgi:DNA-binding SARP family transcriptional activator